MFDIGCSYRRDDLHEFLDGRGNRQSGIIYNPDQQGCVILTSGGHGEEYGYTDEKRVDGSWLYIGQGGQGDQDPDSFANSWLTKRNASVLLFKKQSKNEYHFQGEFVVGGWEWHTPAAGPRAGDKLVRYMLYPIAQDVAHLNLHGAPDVDTANLSELRKAILEQEYRVYESSSEIRKGSAQIRAYARVRADGTCEYCRLPAPFKDKHGQPFLEVHHIHRRADDGPDSPENVAALCPNCHRAAHHGERATAINRELKKLVIAKEVVMLGDG